MSETSHHSYYRYWGKTSEDGGYHLLSYHCLDVAAVGWVLLHPKRALCRRVAGQLKVTSDWLRKWFVFCLMLHDVRKCSRALQNQAPNLASVLGLYRGQCVYQLCNESLAHLFSRIFWNSAFGMGEVNEGLARLMGEKS